MYIRVPGERMLVTFDYTIERTRSRYQTFPSKTVPLLFLFSLSLVFFYGCIFGLPANSGLLLVSLITYKDAFKYLTQALGDAVANTENFFSVYPYMKPFR